MTRNAGVGAGIFVAATLLATAAWTQPFIINSGTSEADRLAVVVLDLGGNGIDLGGKATTALLTPDSPAVRWTKPGTDDAFLTCRADLLSQLGLDPMMNRGLTGDATAMLLRGVSGGLRFGNAAKRPGRPGRAPLDVWAALGMLDANHDGVVDAADPAWNRLWAFVDANGNGAIDAGEERSLTDAGVTALRLAADAHGDREFVRGDGRVGVLRSVILATPASRRSQKRE